jgi:hypothetical protein
VKRSANIVATDSAKFEVVWEEAGWRVFHERGKRAAKIALVDPAGYAHPIPSRKEGAGVIDPVERAAAKACHLEARRAPTLAQHVPSPGALRHLFEGTPRNSNVRLLPHHLELGAVSGDDVRAPLHDAQAVVERVTELGDVEIRDVRDDER